MGLEGHRALFISYNGMLDPLGQTQVIPYLRELVRRGIRFTLLSFERDLGFGPDGAKKCDELQRELASDGIEWHWLRYHRKPSLPATIYDVLVGVRYASNLVKRNRIELVHARSHIPATIALALKKRFGIKMIFDLRGLMADEYVDAGHWRKGSLPYRLTQSMESKSLAISEGVVTLTERIWPIIKEWDALRNRDNVAHEVVPCCADLKAFKFDLDDRELRRNELGLAGRFVIVYSGSIDGWYLTDAMADFFASFLKSRADAHALWLTPSKHERIRQLMRERELAESRYTILAVDPRDVSSYLSASDAGLAFIKPCFSKLASSPTKYAEYLACGLPLIINSGIGDADSLITKDRAGALVKNFSEDEYMQALSIVENLWSSAEDKRRFTRGIAERLFDVSTVGVERYARLYESVLLPESWATCESDSLQVAKPPLGW